MYKYNQSPRQKKKEKFLARQIERTTIVNRAISNHKKPSNSIDYLSLHAYISIAFHFIHTTPFLHLLIEYWRASCFNKGLMLNDTVYFYLFFF